ncbi:MAG: cupredoxin family copper-binding protein [Gemmatimonadales bacterium]|jgi:plastocyanin
MIRMRRRRAGKIILAVAACCGTLVPGLTACAQPVTERTPNVQGTWVTSPWTVYFQFAHRFEVVGDATIGDIFTDGKVVNYPTFELDFGFPFGTMVGVRYSSNSLVQSNFNEWQPYVKWAPIRGVGDGSFSLSYLGAYNGASKSFDSELSSQTRFGPVQILGAVRGFTNPYEVPDSVSSASLALAGGLGFKINRYLQLGGDVGGIVAGLDGIPVAWSGQLGIGIPFTPHTFSIVATNVASGTLEGVSSGVSGAVFWGFEFTVPFSGFARWGKVLKPGEVAADTFRLPPGGAVVEVEVARFAFGPEELRIPPGTTVRWVNKDPVVHTATSDDGVWESPSLAPGETFSFTFEEAGEYAYHCIPHPFMKARVIVTGGEEGAASQP